MKRLIVVLFLGSFLWVYPSWSGVDICKRRLKNLSVYNINSDQLFSSESGFEIAYLHWMRDLKAVEGSCPGGSCRVFPPSMNFEFDWRDRFHAAEAADKLETTLFKVTPQFLRSLSAPGADNKSLQEIIELFKKATVAEYGTSKISGPHVRKGISDLEEIWAKFSSGLGLQNYNLSDFTNHSLLFEEAMKRYQSQYGTGLINENVIVGAGFGSLATHVILESMGVKSTSLESVYSLSLLYPLTDDALDKGQDVGRSMKKISELLDGKNPSAETPYEDAVLGLLKNILTEFPTSKFPLMRSYLRNLHEVQLEANRAQRDKRTSDSKILELTIRKGGFTALALAHAALGPLTKGESEFIFKSGVIFQMGDDLLDVAEDIHDGIQTVWTRGMRNQKSFQRVFNLYSTFETELERNGSKILSDSPGAEALREDLITGFRFYLLSAFLNPELDGRIGPILKNKIPFNPSNSKAVAFNLFKEITETRNIDERLAKTINIFGKVFDKHFLKGQYAEFTEGKRPGSSRYNVQLLNPIFPLVKFATKIENFFRGMGESKSMQLRAQTIFWSLTIYHLYLMNQIHSQAVKPVVLFMGVGGLMNFEDETLRNFVPLSSILLTTTYIMQSMGLLP